MGCNARIKVMSGQLQPLALAFGFGLRLTMKYRISSCFLYVCDLSMILTFFNRGATFFIRENKVLYVFHRGAIFLSSEKTRRSNV